MNFLAFVDDPFSNASPCFKTVNGQSYLIASTGRLVARLLPSTASLAIERLQIVVVVFVVIVVVVVVVGILQEAALPRTTEIALAFNVAVAADQAVEGLVKLDDRFFGNLAIRILVLALVPLLVLVLPLPLLTLLVLLILILVLILILILILVLILNLPLLLFDLGLLVVICGVIGEDGPTGHNLHWREEGVRRDPGGCVEDGIGRNRAVPSAAGMSLWMRASLTSFQQIFTCGAADRSISYQFFSNL